MMTLDGMLTLEWAERDGQLTARAGEREASEEIFEGARDLPLSDTSPDKT